MEVIRDEEHPSKLDRKGRLSISFDGNLLNVFLISISKNSVPFNGCIETESVKSSRGNADQDTEEDVWFGVNVEPGG